MYFEADTLESKLKCFHCKKTFVEPKLLPCGETLCFTCVVELTNDRAKVVGFNCIFCKDFHYVPPQGFPTQQVIIELINLPRTRVCRSKIYDETQDLIDSCELANSKFKPEFDIFKFKFENNCNMLSTDITRKNITNKNEEITNREIDVLLGQLNIFKHKSLNDVTDAYDTIQNVLAVSWLNKLEEWNEYLKKADTNEETVREMYQGAIDLYESITRQFDRFCELIKRKLNARVNIADMKIESDDDD